MRIHLTEKLSISSNSIAEMCNEPFNRTVNRIKKQSREAAAVKYVQEHPWTLTMQTLPDAIYERIPMAKNLWVKVGNRIETIDLGDHEFPHIKGLCAGHPGYANTIQAEAKLQEVIDGHPEAKKEWEECEPIAERGEKFAELVKAYLDEADFTTPTQIAWSAPELTGCILTLQGTGSGGYYGRRQGAHAIFLDRLNKRRYIDRSKMRRPKIVKTQPPELLPYIGEAKLLHAANKQVNQ